MIKRGKKNITKMNMTRMMTAAAMSLAMAATCMAVEVDHPQIPPRAAGPIMQTLKTTDAPMIPRPEHPRPQFEREAWI
ncbi:MAG: hypothetical protein WCJ14_11090, partial [Verrucomicrobiota bacterium]